MSIQYRNGEYYLEQSMGEDIFQENGNYSSYGDTICVALEAFGNVVFMLSENNWNSIFQYEFVIRFYCIFYISIL